jgi:hypothetical protein
MAPIAAACNLDDVDEVALAWVHVAAREIALPLDLTH